MSRSRRGAARWAGHSVALAPAVLAAALPSPAGGSGEARATASFAAAPQASGQIIAPSEPIVAPALALTVLVSSLDGSVLDAHAGTQERFTLAADVLFAFNQANLSVGSRQRLALVATRVGQANPPSVRIDGYTDSVGSAAYNLVLSRRRAAAVRRALAPLIGSQQPRFAVAGHGRADPVAANTDRNGADNPRGRALNRRVTITFGV